MSNPKKNLRNHILLSILALLAIIAIISAVAGVSLFAQQPSEEQEVSRLPMTPERASVSRFAFLAAAVAFGLGAIGAGVAIGNVGAAAMGAVAEKPEIAGQALIFVALAEGLVVFGFITALMILGKV